MTIAIGIYILCCIDIASYLLYSYLKCCWQAVIENWKHEESTGNRVDTKPRHHKKGDGLLEVDSAKKKAIDKKHQWKIGHLTIAAPLWSSGFLSCQSMKEPCMLTMYPGGREKIKLSDMHEILSCNERALNKFHVSLYFLAPYNA